MIRILLADANPDERSAFRLMLQDLRVKDVREATDWHSALSEATTIQPDLILVDFDLLPEDAETAMDSLRKVCPGIAVLLLFNRLDPRWPGHRTLDVEGLLSKDDSSEIVFERLSAMVRSLNSGELKEKT